MMPRSGPSWRVLIATVALAVSLFVSWPYVMTVYAAAAFDATANSACNGGGGGTPCPGGTDSLTYALTVGTGSERALVVFVTVTGSSGTVQPAVSTVTYAGVNLTRIVHAGTNYYTDLWSLPAGTQPTSGSNNVIVTLASNLAGGADSLVSGAISATGIDQSTTFTSTNSATGSGATASVTLSSSGGSDLVVHAACSGTSMTSTPQTQQYINNFSAAGACGTQGGATAAGGTTSLSWSVTSDSWIIVGGSLRASTGGASETPRMLLMGVGAEEQR
jgi:fibronectin-binding autotransporter adhesin